jgi:lipopolysaccharide/colanic/teichoic acid biosynthesis glycosyltransferase
LSQARQNRGVFEDKLRIGGLAQVDGVDMSDPEKLAALDAQYIARRCLALDFKIAIATVVGHGFGDREKHGEINDDHR